MLEFLRRLFSPEPRSSETAKERLRLVLLSDHLSLAPDVVEALKRDLLAVISRYLEIDPTQADVTFEQREREVAMLASIPITGVRERTAALTENAPTAPVPAPVAAPAGAHDDGAAALPEHAADEPQALEPQALEPQAREPQPEDEATWEPGEPPAAAAPPEKEPESPASDGAVEALGAAQSFEAIAPVTAIGPAQATGSSARRRRRKKAAAALANRPPQAHGSPGFGPA